MNDAPDDRVWAVVPLRGLRGAKLRLQGALDDDERAALVAAMARDVLAALAGAAAVDRVLVVTNDEDVAALAAERGASAMPEGEGAGLSAAVANAAKALVAEGVGTMMVVHGDLPLARPEDFDTLLAVAAPAPSVTIAPCRQADGSNVMVCRPPDAIAFCYGPGSCTAHQMAAREAGVAAAVRPVRHLGLDIDTPADLAVLLDHLAKGEVGGATAEFLAIAGLAARLR